MGALSNEQSNPQAADAFAFLADYAARRLQAAEPAQIVEGDATIVDAG